MTRMKRMRKKGQRKKRTPGWRAAGRGMEGVIETDGSTIPQCSFPQFSRGKPFLLPHRLHSSRPSLPPSLSRYLRRFLLISLFSSLFLA